MARVGPEMVAWGMRKKGLWDLANGRAKEMGKGCLICQSTAASIPVVEDACCSASACMCRDKDHAVVGWPELTASSNQSVAQVQRMQQRRNGHWKRHGLVLQPGASGRWQFIPGVYRQPESRAVGGQSFRRVSKLYRRHTSSIADVRQPSLVHHRLLPHVPEGVGIADCRRRRLHPYHSSASICPLDTQQ